MHRTTLLAVVVAVFAVPAISSAQTVQLPTFTYTTGVTTVLVPDQGEVLMGGIYRASDSRNQFGVPVLGHVPVLGRPFNNSSIAQNRGATTLSVKAQIHDFEAMDEAILAEAAARRGGAPLSLAGTNRSSGNLNGNAVHSLAAIERQREAQDDEKRFEVANLLAKAQAAEAGGRGGVARIFYNMVAKHTKDPAERAMAQERVAALSKPKNSAKVAANSPPDAHR